MSKTVRRRSRSTFRVASSPSGCPRPCGVDGAEGLSSSAVRRERRPLVTHLPLVPGQTPRVVGSHKGVERQRHLVLVERRGRCYASTSRHHRLWLDGTGSRVPPSAPEARPRGFGRGNALLSVVIMRHRDDYVSLFAASLDIPVSLGDLLQRIGSIYDRLDRARLNKSFEKYQIFNPI
jgi:hypothetical protein